MLVLLIASIPVAMPAVMSVTMALGALKLSRQKAIVSRLSAIEELAGVDVLCSDKTGTLTQNQLTLDTRDLVQRLARPRTSSSPPPWPPSARAQIAIDQAVLAAVKNPEKLSQFAQMAFAPFDPVEQEDRRHGGQRARDAPRCSPRARRRPSSMLCEA